MSEFSPYYPVKILRNEARLKPCHVRRALQKRFDYLSRKVEVRAAFQDAQRDWRADPLFDELKAVAQVLEALRQPAGPAPEVAP